MRMTFIVVSLLAVSVLPGCYSKYTTPGGPADFRALGITAAQADAMTDGVIRQRMNRQPAATFPASIAVVRVQDGRYSSYSLSRGDVSYLGEYSVVNKREVEDTVDMATLRSLPGVRDISMMNRLVMPASVRSEMDLRASAADLHSDILFLYTFDTRFGSETQVPLLGVITLGLFPAEQARVSTTVSGAFIDTRTGFIYGLVEASADEKQIANAWTTRSAIDQSRRRAETTAFKQMVNQAVQKWHFIVGRYGGSGA